MIVCVIIAIFFTLLIVLFVADLQTGIDDAKELSLSVKKHTNCLKKFSEHYEEFAEKLHKKQFCNKTNNEENVNSNNF